MPNWSDTKLRAHKRAQGHISSTGATLGIAALTAAGVKTSAGRRGAVKLARVANRVGPQAGGKIVRSQRKVGGSVQGLTVGSAGVGGVGGYNFAAIQGQESRRRNVGKALAPGMTRAAISRAESIAVRTKPKRMATAFPQGGLPRKPIKTSGGAKTMVLAPLQSAPKPTTSAPAAMPRMGMSRGAKAAAGGAALAGAGGVGYAAGRRSKVGKSVWGVDHGYALDADRKM